MVAGIIDASAAVRWRPTDQRSDSIYVSSTQDTLKAAFVAGLGISPDSDFELLQYRGIEAWDSVAHMQLIAEIEDAFGIMLETDDVLGLSSFAAAEAIVARHGATA